MALEDRWSELSEERKAKMRACKTPEELLSVAREEGYELTDVELEAVAGGASWLCELSCSLHEESCVHLTKSAS